MSRRSIYKGRVVDLGIEEAELPDGRQVELEVIRHPGAAAVVPMHTDGTITLVHQYRHAGGGMFYEIPAGLIETGEEATACAHRELGEEAGLLAGTLDHLISLHTTPGFTDEVIEIFLGSDLAPTASALDADEYLTPVRLPLKTLLEMIEHGEITDGKTICGILIAHQRMQGAKL